MATPKIRNTERNLIANIAMYLNGFSVNNKELEHESGTILAAYTPYTFLQSNQHILTGFNVKTGCSVSGDKVQMSFVNNDKSIEFEFDRKANTVNCRYG